MSAFNYGVLGQLQQTVRTLYSRRRQIGRLNLTHEEYIQTFVPFEARDMFREAAQYVVHESRTHRFQLGGLMAYIVMKDEQGHRAPPVPRDLQIQRDAPKDVVERIRHWAEYGGDSSRDFGRVQKVMGMLNDQCSKTMMRYYWPTVLAICSEHIDTKQYAVELQDLKTPANPKPLPRELLKAMRQTSETIATARLIPHDVEESENGEVAIDIAPGQTYKEPFAEFYGMT